MKKPEKKPGSVFTPIQLDPAQVLTLHQVESLASVVRKHAETGDTPVKKLHTAMAAEARQLQRAAEELEDNPGKKLAAKQLDVAYSLMNHGMEAAAHILQIEGEGTGKVTHLIASNAETALVRAAELANICEKATTNDAVLEQTQRVKAVKEGFMESYEQLKQRRDKGDSTVKSICEHHNALQLPEAVISGIKESIAAGRQGAAVGAVAQLG